MSTTNGTQRAQWRSIENAQLSRLDPVATAKRHEDAMKMVREGKTTPEIQAALKPVYGFGISPVALAEERRRMKREAKREARRAARLTAPKPKPAPAVEKVPPAAEPQWARLPANIETVTALVAAKVPFIFDGTTVSLKAAK